jgi:MFS family permease
MASFEFQIMDQTNDNNRRTPLHLESSLDPPATTNFNSNDNYNKSSLGSLGLLLLTTWWNDAMWPGLGLFGESYLLFSLGLLQPFWATLYPDCFSSDEQQDPIICSNHLLHSLTYSVVLGVIAGMLLLGYAANRIGRRTGSIMTASFMAGGSIGLALSSFLLANHDDDDGDAAADPNVLFRTMSVLLFIFGIGVGGEYPLSSSTATEKAMGDMNHRLKQELEREAVRRSATNSSTTFESVQHLYAQQQNHDTGNENDNSSSSTTKRGQAVQLVFLSQGTGILANSLILVLLLVLFRQYGDNVADDIGYSSEALLAIWRIVYSIGAIVLTFVLVSRIAYLQESTVWTDDLDRRAKLDRAAVVAATVEVEYEQLEQPPALAPALSNVSSLSTPSSVMVGEASTMSDFMYSPPGNEKADVSAKREYDNIMCGCL